MKFVGFTISRKFVIKNAINNRECILLNSIGHNEYAEYPVKFLTNRTLQIVTECHVKTVNVTEREMENEYETYCPGNNSQGSVTEVLKHVLE